MTNTLQIFEHSNFGSIRTMFDENGKVIFCGKDIAKALGYSDTVNALKQHCCGVVKHHLIDSLGRQQEATFIFRCPLDGEYKIGKNWAETH